MELRGKIIDILAQESGVAKSGNQWKKQEFVIETIEQYPRKICLQIFGEQKVNDFSYYKVGQEIICKIQVESKEFNGRWYTTVLAWHFQGVQTNR